MKRARILASISLIYFASLNQLAAQQDLEDKSISFMNLNAGFGIPYGGLGGNFELGIGHFSTFCGLGYAWERSIDSITIDPTVNYLLGFRYYFDVNSTIVFPRVGLSFGWVTNYYNENIGSQPYRQKAEGLSLHTGLQVYSTEGIVVNLDLVMSSKYVILNAEEHPHFYPFYIRPAIGIGIDLNSISFQRREKKKTIKNKEIDPLGG